MTRPRPDRSSSKRSPTPCSQRSNGDNEVTDAIVEREQARRVEAIRRCFGTSHLAAQAVNEHVLDQLTQDVRNKTLPKLEDLNKQLSFTSRSVRQSSGENLELRPFSAAETADIFATRTAEIGAAVMIPAAGGQPRREIVPR